MIEIKGIITALVTPFNPDGEVKEEALRELIEFQIKSGIDGFYPCGTAGSGPIMRPEQRKRVAQIVVEQTGDRVPVIVHVGAADTETTIDLARHAEKVGADALGCVTPYYYAPDEEALLVHYKRVAKSVNLPVFVYNIPLRTNVNIGPELMIKLAGIPNITGVKDSSRDFMQLLGYLQGLPENFTVIVGTDAYILPALIMGAKGAVTAYSNPFPEIYITLYDLYKKGEYRKAAKIQLHLNTVRNLLRKPQIAPLQEALKLRGIDAGTVRSPLRPMTDSEKEILRSSLIKLGALKT